MIRVGRSRTLGAANAVVRWLFELSDGATQSVAVGSEAALQ
jgi:hypothetical protein